jgi:hypothetical protein
MHPKCLEMDPVEPSRTLSIEHLPQRWMRLWRAMNRLRWSSLANPLGTRSLRLLDGFEGGDRISGMTPAWFRDDWRPNPSQHCASALRPDLLPTPERSQHAGIAGVWSIAIHFPTDPTTTNLLSYRDLVVIVGRNKSRTRAGGSGFDPGDRPCPIQSPELQSRPDPHVTN